MWNCWKCKAEFDDFIKQHTYRSISLPGTYLGIDKDFSIVEVSPLCLSCFETHYGSKILNLNFPHRLRFPIDKKGKYPRLATEKKPDISYENWEFREIVADDNHGTSTVYKVTI